MQRCVLCRSQREHSQEYLLANIGVDTAENGPLKVCQKLLNSPNVRTKVIRNVGGRRVRRGGPGLQDRERDHRRQVYVQAARPHCPRALPDEDPGGLRREARVRLQEGGAVPGVHVLR